MNIIRFFYRITNSLVCTKGFSKGVFINSKIFSYSILFILLSFSWRWLEKSTESENYLIVIISSISVFVVGGLISDAVSKDYLTKESYIKRVRFALTPKGRSPDVFYYKRVKSQVPGFFEIDFITNIENNKKLIELYEFYIEVLKNRRHFKEVHTFSLLNNLEYKIKLLKKINKLSDEIY